MSTNQITTDDFHHIAHLSRIPLKPQDDVIASQLSQAADYVGVLDELDISQVEPTFQVNNKKNVFRTDDVKPSLSQDLAVSQAQKSTDGYFVTKATIKK